jgi:hypothetical protein
MSFDLNYTQRGFPILQAANQLINAWHLIHTGFFTVCTNYRSTVQHPRATHISPFLITFTSHYIRNKHFKVLGCIACHGALQLPIMYSETHNIIKVHLYNQYDDSKNIVKTHLPASERVLQLNTIYVSTKKTFIYISCHLKHTAFQWHTPWPGPCSFILQIPLSSFVGPNVFLRILLSTPRGSVR